MNSEEKYTLIEKYLAEELEGKDLTTFEAQLQTDAELKEELTLHRQITDTLKGQKVHDLRNVLKEVDQNWDDSSKKSKSAKIVKFNFRKILSVAAAIVLLFIGYQWFFNNDLSTQEIYASNFEPYPMLLDQRSIDEDGSPSITLNKAISFYSNKENAAATAAFQQLLESDPENIIYIFYLANSHLANQEAKKAVPYFEKIITLDDPSFVEQSRWYLALAYLQKNNKENAKAILEKIQKGQYHFREAQNILNNL